MMTILEDCTCESDSEPHDFTCLRWDYLFETAKIYPHFAEIRGGRAHRLNFPHGIWMARCSCGWADVMLDSESAARASATGHVIDIYVEGLARHESNQS